MNNNNHRGQWAGCSDLTERRKELLKAHEEFQRMLDNGYQLKEVKVKRHRIKKEAQPKQVVVTLGGNWTIKLSFEEYKQRGDGLKIVMKIY
jgi:hypothetical protein